MAINLRSPYFVGTQAPVGGYILFDIYVYTTTKPLLPTYSIRKERYGSDTLNDSVYVEIAELIRDYLDIKFNGQYLSNGFAVLFEVEYSVRNSSDTETTSGNYGVQLGFDSYSYFEDANFDIHSQGLAQSNNIIYVPADTFARIPISTYNSPTITFFKDNKIVSSYTYTRSDVANNQFKYINLNGEVNYDDYKDRVLDLNDGIFEDSTCLHNFLNKVDVGEVDEVTITDNTGKRDVVKVKQIAECKYEPKKITFLNKFGALQDMYFFKKFVEKMDVSKENYKRNISTGVSYSRNKHQQQEFNINGNKSFTLSSGFISEEYNEVFQQLLLSEYVWIEVDNIYRVLPINVKTSNITYKNSVNDKLVEYTIDFEYSFDVINNIR